MADQPSSSDVLYTVTRLAAELGVTARTIRFYEDKGLIMPGRAGSTRVYSHRDRARMTLILRGKRLGFSLREIREFLALYVPGDANLAQTRKLLTVVRERLAALEEQRRAVDQTVHELREIEAQALASLAAAPRRSHRLPATTMETMP